MLRRRISIRLVDRPLIAEHADDGIFPTQDIGSIVHSIHIGQGVSLHIGEIERGFGTEEFGRGKEILALVVPHEGVVAECRFHELTCSSIPPFSFYMKGWETAKEQSSRFAGIKEILNDFPDGSVVIVAIVSG